MAGTTERVLRRAIRVLRAEHDEHREAHARIHLGRLLTQRRSTTDARAEFEWATTVGCAAARAEARYWLGRIYLAEADRMLSSKRQRKLSGAAITELQQSLEHDDVRLAADVRAGIGHGYELLGDVETARDMYEAALRVAMPERRDWASLALAQFLVRNKMWAEAEPVLTSLTERAAPEIARSARELRNKRPR